jgi:dihydrofolate reductase
MRDLIVYAQMTLDGVMQAQSAPEEDPSGGFEHGGWAVGYFDDDLMQALHEGLAEPFDLVLGRKTYEVFAPYWPHQEGVIADAFNRATKHVASTTLSELSWDNSHLIEPDVPTGVAALKEQKGPDLQVHGSVNLVQTLLKHRLVDEIFAMTYPVMLGEGKNLFGEGVVPTGLELTRSRDTSSGVVIANYRLGSEIKYGSLASDDPSPEELERRAKQASGPAER